MPAGLEIYNASGQPIVSITDRVGRILGSYNVAAGSNGSFNVPELAQGQPFVVSVPSQEGNPAYVRAIGTTVSWEYLFSYAYASLADSVIYYGVY